MEPNLLAVQWHLSLGRIFCIVVAFRLLRLYFRVYSSLFGFRVPLHYPDRLCEAYAFHVLVQPDHMVRDGQALVVRKLEQENRPAAFLENMSAYNEFHLLRNCAVDSFIGLVLIP